MGDPGDDITPTLEQQKQLVCLNAVIRKSLCLLPPATKLTECKLTTNITFSDGWFVPKDILTTVNIYALHRNPRISGVQTRRFLIQTDDISDRRQRSNTRTHL